MRVLYVIDSLALGGAERSLADMAPGLVAGGVDLHVLSLGTSLHLAADLERAGATVHRRRTAPGRLGSVRAVVATAREVRPDLIHTTLFEADIAGRIGALLHRVPVSTSIVSDSYGPQHYSEANTLKLHAARTLDAVTALASTRFHAISSAIALSVPPRLGISPDLVHVIPRGRDPEKYPFQRREQREAIRGELAIDPRSPVVLAVGRVEPAKGLQHLVAAVPAVLARHPNTVTLIAGPPGRATPDLQRQARSLGADVRFLGYRADVNALLAAADVFCFPSEREGFGGALIEALAVGCPIVASDIPTSKEILGEGNACAGVLTPTRDATKLGRALIQVLDDGEAAAARAHCGRARFDSLYTIDAVVDQMITFFNASVRGKS